MAQLNEQQRTFVLAYTSDPGAIGNASEAARRAGYSPKSAAEIGRQLLEKPHVRAAVDAANREQISGALAAKAVAVLREIVEDQTAAPKLRLDAAKTILDRAGHVTPPPKVLEQRLASSNDDMKELEELSLEELREIIVSEATRLTSEAEGTAH